MVSEALVRLDSNPMAVADVMAFRVVKVSPDDTVRVAIARMLEENVGSVAVCEGEPTLDHAKLYKRLAAMLYGLAPQAIRTTGQRAVQFFVADGKYRVQAFALEDLADRERLCPARGGQCR